MKTLPLLAFIASAAQAGTPPGNPAITPPAGEDWIKPLIDIRARYEYADIGSPALGSANALTFRERIGLETRPFRGFSTLIEGEFLQAACNNYDSGPGASTHPDNPALTGISDPRTNELNQAFLRYRDEETTLIAGRQRIILDNAAFVGNVVWRQNEQTYDALSITNTSIEDLTLFYACANRANRIFGSEASGALKAFEGDIHLLHAAYTGFRDATLTGYIYLMDFNRTSANANYISNNTYGIIASAPAGPFNLYGELALQTDVSGSPAAKPGRTHYAHLNASMKAGENTFTLGWECLGADFVTPLATVHAYNGYADAFINPRIGLVRNPGLNDIYLTHAVPMPILGIGLSQSLHLFGDNDSNFDFGWEYDTTLTRKFNDNLLAIVKCAWFDSSGAGTAANPAPFDTTRLSIELNYHF
ncbi:hypothetical protein HZ994_10700 [Akkermansiaceae bacterium]|nr:hypothetical protein HZ994_10700 [Akkermansiaceae bacterium]